MTTASRTKAEPGGATADPTLPNRREALGRLMRGIGEDVRDYRGLLDLLEAQFSAALRHQSTRLAELADEVTAQVQRLEGRRRERVTLVRTLAGPTAGIADAFALLPPAQRAATVSGWQSLETMARRCKALNIRNCQLLMGQHDIMQRVLHGDETTYAPV